MAEAPQPVQKSGRPAPPVGRKITATTRNDQRAPSGMTPQTATPMEPMLLEAKEAILIAGDSWTGKSYAYMRKALKEFLDPVNWTEGELGKGEYIGPKFYLVDTDTTAPTFLGPGCEFSQLLFSSGGNVYPFPARNWQECRRAISAAVTRAQQGDWIVLDTMTRMNEQARDQVATQRGIVYDEAAFERGNAGRGFGAFEANEWNLVSIIHDSAFNSVRNSPANYVGIMHVTQMVDTRERREALLMFDQVGLRPRGRPTVPSICDTVVVLWSRLMIPRDERKRRVGTAKVERWMNVIKDRGQPFGVQEMYDRDFFDTLDDLRLSASKPDNIADAAESDTMVASTGEEMEVAEPKTDD